MKIVFKVIITLFILSGCGDEQNSEQPDFISGNWKLTETFSHPPTGNGWSQVENGFVVKIENTGNFTSSQFNDCLTGTVKITETEISFRYSCSGFTAGFEEPAGTFSYKYQLVNDSEIELTPLNYTCFEGCSQRLVKIGDLTE